ncbi:hypothetical protein QQZ08_009762 [Neonectria magnoliae]|uniref:Uncharacterized protein n=1 Tax=Neonectria magnoliae TaxID=2732573 RepID=A0ABR1HL83_9HYPO
MAGLLGGVAIFSSSERLSGANLKLKDSKITTLGNTMPELWFGNAIIGVLIDNTQINHTSGVLITWDFDQYASYEENSNL